MQKRSLRWSEGVCAIEGPDLVDAALHGGVEFEALYVDVNHLDDDAIAALCERARAHGVRTFSLAAGVLERVADAQTPQPVVAAVRFATYRVTDLAGDGLVLVLHEVRDPGNAGTIIRSADAAGASAVIFTGQSVDPYNPKTLRATAGSIFHLPICVATLAETLSHFTTLGVTSYASVVHGGQRLREVDLSAASVVVVGNESTGLDAASTGLCDAAISIPMVGRNESLNAGVAASLIAFEAMSQRQGATPSPPPPSL